MQNSSGDTYNRGGFIAFLFSMVFSILFFVYIAIIYPGIDLKEIPAEGEAPTQSLAQSAAAPKVDISKIEKPWLSSDDLIAYGKASYVQNCAVCHGNSGAGDGPAGKGLVPPPRDLIEGKWVKGGTAVALYKTLQEGLDGTSMASFAHIPKADRWAIVHYVRSISKNSPKDDPKELESFAAQAE